MNSSDDLPTVPAEASSVMGHFQHAVMSIKTPVTVTLARKRESLDRILNLVPGSMLTFDTHCDEPLTLEAGGHKIASGETIKIGDKFGLRIREIFTPTDEN